MGNIPTLRKPMGSIKGDIPSRKLWIVGPWTSLSVAANHWWKYGEPAIAAIYQPWNRPFIPQCSVSWGSHCHCEKSYDSSCIILVRFTKVTPEFSSTSSKVLKPRKVSELQGSKQLKARSSRFRGWWLQRWLVPGFHGAIQSLRHSGWKRMIIVEISRYSYILIPTDSQQQQQWGSQLCVLLSVCANHNWSPWSKYWGWDVDLPSLHWDLVLKPGRLTNQWFLTMVDANNWLNQLVDVNNQMNQLVDVNNLTQVASF